ncbi:MAG: prepilin peptidase [Candidatus Riflebacteria bacterium]|nr:prepilin peptidase [Candidatus Riflebacteria bacterium]
MVVLKGVAVAGSFVAMVTDLRHGKIYNWLTFPLIFSGWAVHAWLFGAAGLAASVGATCLGFALYLGFALVGVIGMGDVKLLGGVGAWGGWSFVVWVFLFASVVSIPHALLIQYLNYGRDALGMLMTSLMTGAFLRKSIQDENRSSRYRFFLGLDILLGCLIAWFLAGRLPW